jgi:transposase InsO family protein
MYRIVSAEKARTPISVACELLGVSRSGYHAWATRAPSDRDLSDAWLIDRIEQIDVNNREVYGARCVQAELRLGHGIVVSRKRVQRLMHPAEISGLVSAQARAHDDPNAGRPRRRRPRPARLSPRPARRAVVADITYLKTCEGWLDLAAVQDGYSRRIVGWSMADPCEPSSSSALQMALRRRRPDPGLVHHPTRAASSSV